VEQKKWCNYLLVQRDCKHLKYSGVKESAWFAGIYF
jgi:hypothetical protein